MTTTVVESSKADAPTARDRAMDTARHAAHVSHEAELLTSLAADAMEDGAHAVKRAIKSAKRGVEQMTDLRDDAAHWVRQQPLKAVAIGAGTGLLVGVAVGLIAARFGMRRAVRRQVIETWPDGRSDIVGSSTEP